MSTDIESVLLQHGEALSKEAKVELVKSLEALAALQKRKRFHQLFPDHGEFRRELYAKHLEFFTAGAKYRERLFMAANRVGKSEAGSFEITCHATGLYPHWWTGKRFSRATKIWVGGDTNGSVRDIIQQKLLGDFGSFGTGMIPADCIKDTTTKRAVPEAIETIKVKHISGGISLIVLKTYEQGRELWQGTEQDVIWLDEEPPQDVYSEALIRTMTTGGIVMLTFTPLRGLSNVVLSYMDKNQDNEPDGTKFKIMATWDDVPHLTQQMKDELFSAIPPNERDARSKGIPVIGAGLIYPVDENKVFIEDFPVPRFWPRMYGMDVGWNKTAVVWGALDRETDTVYIYSEYYAGEQEAVVHAKAIKSRGEHLKGVIDPAARGRNQIDGKTLFTLYTNEGLKISPANNAVESGIYEVWDRFNTGRLKIFKSCKNIQDELKLYHRDEKGKIKKTRDHLCLAGDTQVSGKSMSDIGVPTGLREVHCLLTEDGNITKATPDHMFLGIDALWYPTCITKGITLIKGDMPCKLLSYQKLSKDLMVRSFTNVDSIFNDLEKDYIEQFGNIITVKFQKSVRSTIKTKIEQIIKSKTWNVSENQNTLLTMVENDMRRVLLKPLQKLLIKQRQFGMDRLGVDSGILSTIKTTKKSSIESLLENALSADNLTKQLEYILQQVSALITVNQPIDVVCEKTLLNAYVQFVETNLSAINIIKRKLVPENVEPHCVEVQEVQKGELVDTYCLYVPFYHNYILDNGLVSHNCDSLRYLINSNIYSTATTAVEQEKRSKVIPLKVAAWT